MIAIDVAEHNEEQIRQIAQEVYNRRKRSHKPKDAQSDWETAEKISRSRWRRVLFENNRLFVRLRRPAARATQFAFWDIPRWFLFTLPSLEWMKLLAVPLVLGAVGSIITSQIQREANQNAVLKEYFDQLQTLTFNHNLLAEIPDTGAIVLARGRTVATLRELDLKRKEQLIAFLQASGLSRREEEGDSPVISFENQNLAGLDLRGIDLSGIDFRGAILENANFQGADLEGANLQEARISNANLRGAILSNANLQRANLERTNLQETSLIGANLQGARLWESNLQEAILVNANLQEALLLRANLRKADLKDANLQRAFLPRNNLQETNLWNTNLRGASLFSASLQGAVLLATNLEDVREITLEQVEGKNAPFLCGVNLPSNLTNVNPNRDCDRVSSILINRYPWISPGEINVDIEEAKQKEKEWE